MSLSYSSDDALPPESQTLRLWLSDQQWMSLISRIEQQRAQAPTTDRPSAAQRRRDRRLPATLRCLLRLTRSDGTSATYAVRSTNLSRGGLGFFHDQPLPVAAACTVALEQPGRGGRVLAALVAWSSAVAGMDGVYEVGLQFAQPIELDPFLQTDQDP